MMNRKIAAAAAALVVGATTLAASATPADAATGCATRAEYRHVKHGMSVAKVKHIYGTGGHLASSSSAGGYRFVIRDYRTCTPFHVTNVSFDANPGQPLTVSGKLYI